MWVVAAQIAMGRRGVVVLLRLGCGGDQRQVDARRYARRLLRQLGRYNNESMRVAEYSDRQRPADDTAGHIRPIAHSSLAQPASTTYIRV